MRTMIGRSEYRCFKTLAIILVYPTLPVSFGRDTKSCWPLLYGAYARGRQISNTWGKCVTSRGSYVVEIRTSTLK